MRKLLVLTTTLVIATGGAFLLIPRTPIGFLAEVVSQQNPGPFDRAYLESIVSQLRAAGLKTGEKEIFVIDSTSGRIQQMSPGMGYYKSYVVAQVSAVGLLEAVIVTRKLGHAGDYGFAFSDTPWVVVSDSKGTPHYHVSVDDHFDVVSKIDEHWCEVANHWN